MNSEKEETLQMKHDDYSKSFSDKNSRHLYLNQRQLVPELLLGFSMKLIYIHATESKMHCTFLFLEVLNRNIIELLKNLNCQAEMI